MVLHHPTSRVLQPMVLTFALFALARPAFATSGWDDIRVEIAPDYHLGNGGLSRGGADGWGTPVLLFHDYPVGRMADYAVTDENIFTRHRGPPTMYFIVRKSDGVIDGPLTGPEFATRPVAQVKLRWITPTRLADSTIAVWGQGLVMLCAGYPVVGIVVCVMVFTALFLSLAILREAFRRSNAPQ
jgi:hypothetical protein